MGIETYESALRSAKARKGERDYLAGLVVHDEALVGRHHSLHVHRGGEKLAEWGVGLFVTDRRLLVVGSAGGLVKPKFKHWSFSYRDTAPTVARTEFSVVPGSKPYYVAGFVLRSGGEAFMASFDREADRNSFADEFEGRMIPYRD